MARIGTAGPALAGNEALQDEVHVLRQIIYGGGAMPAFGQQLTDEEVATVATFIRTERLGEQFRSCTCGGGSTAALARQAGSK